MYVTLGQLPIPPMRLPPGPLPTPSENYGAVYVMDLGKWVTGARVQLWGMFPGQTPTIVAEKATDKGLVEFEKVPVYPLMWYWVVHPEKGVKPQQVPFKPNETVNVTFRAEPAAKEEPLRVEKFGALVWPWIAGGVAALGIGIGAISLLRRGRK